MPYSSDDQDFFFNTANSILERFHHLDDIAEEYLFDVILWFSDELVNGLDNFVAWKKANSKPKTEGSVAKDPFPRPTTITV